MNTAAEPTRPTHGRRRPTLLKPTKHKHNNPSQVRQELRMVKGRGEPVPGGRPGQRVQPALQGHRPLRLRVARLRGNVRVAAAWVPAGLVICAGSGRWSWGL